GAGCASEVSFNLKGRAVLLHSWSPTEAITTGPLSLFTERGESTAAGGRGERKRGRRRRRRGVPGDRGRKEGRRVGEERRERRNQRIITQTTIFTHFTPLDLCRKSAVSLSVLHCGHEWREAGPSGRHQEMMSSTPRLLQPIN
ncbi:hypothetical protein INR49_026644, partial [Caranx melampygus]